MRVRALTTAAVAGLLATLCAAGAADMPSHDLQRTPPPEGSSDPDVVSHVLADELGTWRRDGSMTMAQAEGLPEIAPDESALLETYRARCGAVASYRATESRGSAQVLHIIFAETLDALGFFAAHRGDDARLIVLTSPAFREDGVLHVCSGRSYVRVQAQTPPTEGLPADQYLAARIEMRLPMSGEQPRLLDLLPRGWFDALTVAYAPTKLLGERAPPKALTVSRMLGDTRIELTIIPSVTVARARAVYTMVLRQQMQRGRAFEAPRLGEEAFVVRDGGAVCLGMRQDEYVTCVSAGSRRNAEAVVRLIGSAIRTSRPLPTISAQTDATVP